MSGQPTSGPSAAAKLDAPLVKLALTMVIGSFASLMDSTIIGVAVNELGHTFGTPLSTIQWVITGYLLALSMVIPVTGWAVERFGAKAMWITSIGVFLAGSVLAGSAWSAGSLIAFRVVQGAGGGMMMPIAMTMVVQAAGQARLGRAMSILAVPAQLAPIIGPVIGGLIVDELSWRWLFFVNVPICLVALLASVRYLPPGQRRPAQKLDVIGVALLSPSMAALVYGLSYVGGHGFGDPVALTWLAAGLVLLALYTVHSLRPGVLAVVDLRLFRVRSFASASAVNFLFGVSLFAAMFLLPLYYIQVRGSDARAAGLLLAPQGLGLLLAFLVVGKLTDQMNPRPIILAGMAVATLGTVPFLFVGDGVGDLVLGAALLVRGFGLGAATVPLNAAAYQGLDRAAVPRATSAINIIVRIGSSFGTAVFAVILQHQLAVHEASTAGRAGAFGYTFVWTLVFTVLALLPALLIPAKPAAAVTEAAANRR
jgi:EmrB/QacA subfamily drug resistance transporter